MIVDVKDRHPQSQTAAGRNANSHLDDQPVARADGSRIDEMGESSFPASDPPSVWTWEVNRGTGTPAAQPGTAGT
jgi:hypothetical protein